MFNHQILVQLMTENGVTANDLSEKTRLSPSTIEQWMNGGKEPYPAYKSMLCQMLHCEEADLFNSEVAQKTQNQPCREPLVIKPQNDATANNPPERTEAEHFAEVKNKVSPKPKKEKTPMPLEKKSVIASDNETPENKPVEEKIEEKPVKPKTRKGKATLKEQVDALVEQVLSLQKNVKEEDSLVGLDPKIVAICNEAKTASAEGLTMALSILKNYKK